tara:strand:+ start:3691 stop:4035 length:345 start_codon:yes stop_codon:yes gene_type:complete
MDNNYLYHCAGCKKDDKEYPDKENECAECQGSGRADQGTGLGDDEDYCLMCDGYGTHTPYCRPITNHEWARADAYGIYTGLYCDKCYDDPNKYTYRKDEYYDPAYAGERLEPDG